MTPKETYFLVRLAREKWRFQKVKIRDLPAELFKDLILRGEKPEGETWWNGNRVDSVTIALDVWEETL